MPHFDLFSIIRSLHLLSFALAGGAALVVLVLVGFEESREDVRGLTSILWKRTVAWGFRLAVIFGIILLVMKAVAGARPFDELYLHWKLPLVLLLLGFSEMSPRALAGRKRGAPLLAFLFFLLTVFVSANHGAFGYKVVKVSPGSYTGTVQAQ